MHNFLVLQWLIVRLLEFIPAISDQSRATQLQHESIIATNISASKTPLFFDYERTTGLSPSFGLRKSYTWSTILSNISDWNDNTEALIFRIVVLSRHGQGIHNIAEEKYGTAQWDSKWSRLNGDSMLTWGPDANLTALGKAQARSLRTLWSSEPDLPVPAVKYSSPLSRTMETSAIIFESTRNTSPVRVLEDLRETFGVHTCDQRSTLAQISKRFTYSVFEPDMTENDELWQSSIREDDEHTQLRAASVISHVMNDECRHQDSVDSIFTSTEAQNRRIISITTHSGFIRGLLAELQLNAVDVKTGSFMTLLLQAKCDASVGNEKSS